MTIGGRLRRWATVPSLLGLLTLATGCGGAGPAPSPRPGASLRIAAASDLLIVLPKLIEAFEATRDVDVAPSFGASGNLAEQIRRGAPFDVFLSADMAFVQGLGDEGVIEPDTIAAYARGSLVLIVHPAAADAVDELADLTKPEVGKVAIANPQFAPYGRAAREALERSNLWRTLEPKIVIGESARQALVYEERGDVEAALVGRSLVIADQDGRGDKLIEVDPTLHAPLIQGLGIIAESQAPDQARAFVDFVLGDEGRRILGEAGFKPPDPVE